VRPLLGGEGEGHGIWDVRRSGLPDTTHYDYDNYDIDDMLHMHCLE
jgi:hypothetical protein